MIFKSFDRSLASKNMDIFEIEDIHIFGGQTPVKRLENLNVCRENEFLTQVLNDQISSIWVIK